MREGTIWYARGARCLHSWCEHLCSDTMRTSGVLSPDTSLTPRQRKEDKARGTKRGSELLPICYPQLYQSLTISPLPHSFIHTLLLHSHIINHSCSTISRKREKTDDAVQNEPPWMCIQFCAFTTTSTKPKYAIVRRRMMSRTGLHLA